MDQTGIISAVLVFGFIAFVVTRGQLTAYLQVLGL